MVLPGTESQYMSKPGTLQVGGIYDVGKGKKSGGGLDSRNKADLEAYKKIQAENQAKESLRLAELKAQQEEQARQEAQKKAAAEQQQRVYFVAEKTRLDKGKVIALENQWKPSDPNAAVVYINKQGITTGRSSSNISVPANINVRANTGQGTQQVGDVLAKDIKTGLESQRQQTQVAQMLPGITSQSVYDNNINPNTGRPYGTYTAISKPVGFFGKIEYGLSNYRRKGNKVQKAIAGVGSSVLGTLEFGKYVLTTNPKTTITTISKGLYSTGKKVVTGEGFPEIGETLRLEPEFSTGFVAGEIIQLKAPSLITKTSDIVRTKGLIEVPKEAVIAPEYFAGQKYPQIAKGQTAGQLLQEFKPVERYGVTPLRGFTASPKPFSKETLAQAGTSELPGVYQAPKLSATFLRISGEEPKLIGLNPFNTLRPSAIKITPKSFELIEDVSVRQKGLTNVGKAKSFFNKEAELGKSYVPFIKTEKEAVIPAGTTLVQTNKRFFFKFEGRKVPIFEFETTNIGTDLTKTRTAGSLYSSSYSSNKGSLINPYSVSIYQNYNAKTTYSSSTAKTYNGISKYSYVSSSSPVSVNYPTYSAIYNRGYTSSYYPSNVASQSYAIPHKSSSIAYKSKSIVPYGSYSRPIKSTYYTPITKTKNPKITPYYKPQSNMGSLLSVQVRRGGKFYNIGKASNINQAINIGQSKVGRSLAATFRISGVGRARTPYGFYTKPSKGGLLFIEKRGLRLKRGSGEIPEIQSARRRKRK